jgi:dihydroflavonol-4-reductase
MRAFVTGATGFLGSNLIRLLVEKGHTVKGLVRSAEKAATIFPDSQIEFCQGDLLYVSGFANELEGCDVVFHTAAYYTAYMQDQNGSHPDLEKINVDATRELLQAAREARVQTFVFVSSAGVMQSNGRMRPANEDSPLHTSTPNRYFRSKIQAENAIKEFLSRHRSPRPIIIRPSLMLGPGDNVPTPAGQFIVNLLSGRIKALPPGNMAVVDVRDVALAMESLVHRGSSGECYIVGGNAYTIAELARQVAELGKQPPIRRQLPYPMAMLLAGISDVQKRLSGKGFLPLSRSDLQRMHRLIAPDSSKTMDLLGWKFRPLPETITDTLQWFGRYNYFDKKI